MLEPPSLALALPKPYLSIPNETQIEHFYSSQKNGTHIKGGRSITCVYGLTLKSCLQLANWKSLVHLNSNEYLLCVRD